MLHVAIGKTSGLRHKQNNSTDFLWTSRLFSLISLKIRWELVVRSWNILSGEFAYLIDHNCFRKDRFLNTNLQPHTVHNPICFWTLTTLMVTECCWDFRIVQTCWADAVRMVCRESYKSTLPCSENTFETQAQWQSLTHKICKNSSGTDSQVFLSLYRRPFCRG